MSQSIRTESLTKIVLALMLVPISSSFTFGQTETAGSARGISSSKPTSGPFVDLGNGKFMVPYLHAIETTDIAFEMIPVPGSEVTIGSPDSEEGRTDDEGPQFKVRLKPFWIAKTEVTWAEYKTFLKTYKAFKDLARQNVRKVTDENKVDAVTVPTPLYEPSFTYEFGEQPAQPAVTMTQFAAKQYTKWLSGITSLQYRLPTETEWEYAARAGSTSAYSFGDDASQLGDYAAFEDNSPKGPPKVGSKKPNAFGLYDMHGSVWEWTIDQFDEKSYAERGGKVLDVMDAVRWATSDDHRCARGGGWQDSADRLRSAARLGSEDEDWKEEDPNVPKSPWWYTSDPARMVGMRIVRSLEPLDAKTISKFWEYDDEKIKNAVDYRIEEGRGILGLPVPDLIKDIRKKK